MCKIVIQLLPIFMAIYVDLKLILLFCHKEIILSI